VPHRRGILTAWAGRRHSSAAEMRPAVDPDQGVGTLLINSAAKISAMSCGPTVRRLLQGSHFVFCVRGSLRILRDVLAGILVAAGVRGVEIRKGHALTWRWALRRGDRKRNIALEVAVLTQDGRRRSARAC
jgi:hypothetical protein